jgi:hypothetical protein
MKKSRVPVAHGFFISWLAVVKAVAVEKASNTH